MTKRRVSTTTAFSALCALATTVAAYHWPSPKFDAVEGLLYEFEPEPPNHGSLHLTLSGCVPLNNESKAAEWLRFAYHDMATHNIDDGTGGLDASLYYELDRAENVGNGMRATVFDFIDFPTKYISKSDIIGVGTVLAVAECGGPSIPFRMGRVDSFVAGPPGVPEPSQDLATHTETFRKQGFTQSEMIGLVACGHTLGGVRFPDFPDIVQAPEDGSQLIETFDTNSGFDNSVVTQYLDGTTKNPLVVSSNTTDLSDLRIFSSDNNVTMKGMATPKAFADTCRDLIERMINTVPKDVVLSDVVQFVPAKVASVQLSVTNEALNLKAMLRVSSSSRIPLSTANPLRNVTMFWESRTGGSCNRRTCSSPFVSQNDTTTELTRRMGLSPQKYYFDAPINATTSISKFWFEVDEHNGKKPIVIDNGGTGYVIEQDHVLFDPVRSTHAFSGSNIVVAVKNDSIPSRVYANVMWRVTFTPQDLTVDFAPAPSFPPTAGYTFYQAQIAAPDFTFDLFSTVGGTTYTEDARDSRYVTGVNNTSPFRRDLQKRIERDNLRRELRAKRSELKQRRGH
ncbi:heme peroxidase [Pholiota conissans]|uniref:Peroxidase n=1 Tax=Pholiota conissans TaxID=109636 RepID=A0A9P6D7Z0_9AGAR|nr:heme peroxidase [Pholiota conissans]